MTAEDFLAQHTREHFAMSSSVHAAKSDILKAMNAHALAVGEAVARGFMNLADFPDNVAIHNIRKQDPKKMVQDIINSLNK